MNKRKAAVEVRKGPLFLHTNACKNVLHHIVRPSVGEPHLTALGKATSQLASLIPCMDNNQSLSMTTLTVVWRWRWQSWLLHPFVNASNRISLFRRSTVCQPPRSTVARAVSHTTSIKGVATNSCYHEMAAKTCYF